MRDRNVYTMNFFGVFCYLWMLISSALHCKCVCFHSLAIAVLAFKWNLAATFDYSASEKDERFILPSHRHDRNPSIVSRSPSSLTLTPLSANNNGFNCETPGACNDPNGYDAIRVLHRQLDDDANGNIDVAESDEFLRDELQYENGYERHKEFHGNDKYISVDELWQAWKVSEVHNWTVEETTEWMISYVDLPQYVSNFIKKSVDGTCLPRLAVNTNNYMSTYLGIKDPIHRQKIALKAMDVVLFGPPRHHNYMKDAILITSLVVAIGGCWFAYVQHKRSQKQLQRMMKDMEILQTAEEALLDLQQELNKAKHEQEIVNIEKQDLERRLQDEMTIGKRTLSSPDGCAPEGFEHTRVLELEEMLRSAKSDLHQAEKRLESHSWVPPPRLQYWLQLTHELELRNYNAKKSVAEQQLLAAKEGCEKLRKKRSTFMGAFRIAHGSSIDDVDDRIIQAKAALCEVTSDLQERMNRWKQVELLCDFPIVNNPGLSYLESFLNQPVLSGPSSNLNSGAPLLRSSSEGTLVHEESPPPYVASGGISAACIANCKEDEPTFKLKKYLPHQDSGISLTSNFQVPVSYYSVGRNGNLANIPPPSYSNPSPPYVRKDPVVNLSEKTCVHNSSLSSTKPCNIPSETYIVSDNYSILESAIEEDDQILEQDDCSTERSTTPPSCSSYIDTDKLLYSVPNSSMDSLHEHKKTASVDITDQQSLNSDRVLPDITPSASTNGKNNGSNRKISSGTLDRKKKPGIALFTILRNSLSASNLTDHEQSAESSTTVPKDKEKKKKPFFSQLRNRRTKMM